MGKLGDALAKGLRTLGHHAGALTGQLLPGNGGTPVDFTGRLTDERRTPRPGRYGEVRVERELTIPVGSLAATPVAGDRLTFTGSSAVWSVVLAEPVDGGDTRIGWRLTVRDWINDSE